jgi:hypothetical protein
MVTALAGTSPHHAMHHAYSWAPGGQHPQRHSSGGAVLPPPLQPPSVPSSSVAKPPSRRLVRKHGRFQLWASGVLLSLALCHSILALATNSWIENQDDEFHSVRGKDSLQYALLGVGLLFGLAGYAALVTRFFGWRFAVRAGATFTAKAIILMLLAADAACIFAATELYLSLDAYTAEHAAANGGVRPEFVHGSAYNFALDSGYYILICIALLGYHEINEFWRQRKRKAQRKLVMRQRTPKPSSSPRAAAQGDGRHALPAAKASAGATASASAPPSAPVVPSAAVRTPATAPSLTVPSHRAFQVVLHHDYLSPPQRRFVFAVNIFFVLVYGGGLLYHWLEGWNIRVASDFCLTTLATIGYGTPAPKTLGGRVLLMLYFPIGFASLGFAVSLVWQVVLAKLNSRVRKASALLAGSIARGWIGRQLKVAAPVREEMETVRQKNPELAGPNDNTANKSNEQRPLSPRVAPQQQERRQRGSDDLAAARTGPSGRARSTSPPSSGASSRSSSPSLSDERVGLTSPLAREMELRGHRDATLPVPPPTAPRPRRSSEYEGELAEERAGEFQLASRHIKSVRGSGNHARSGSDSSMHLLRAQGSDGQPLRTSSITASLPPSARDSFTSIATRPAAPSSSGGGMYSAHTQQAREHLLRMSVSENGDAAEELARTVAAVAATASVPSSHRSIPPLPPPPPPSSPPPSVPSPPAGVFTADLHVLAPPPGQVQPRGSALLDAFAALHSQHSHHRPSHSRGSMRHLRHSSHASRRPSATGDQASAHEANPSQGMGAGTRRRKHGPSRSSLVSAMSVLQQRKSTTSVHLILASSFVLAWILLCSIVFAHFETWTYFEAVRPMRRCAGQHRVAWCAFLFSCSVVCLAALPCFFVVQVYFCYVTLTTIGLGDFVPTRGITSSVYLWFVIFGLGAVLYLLSLVGEMLTQRFEHRILQRRRAKHVKAKKRAMEQGRKAHDPRFAPPTALLQRAEEFNAQTAQLIERAKNSVESVKANSHLFHADELRGYQQSYDALLAAESQRQHAFALAWSRGLPLPSSPNASSAAGGGAVPGVPFSPDSHSVDERGEFDWSRTGGAQLRSDNADPIAWLVHGDEFVPCTCLPPHEGGTYGGGASLPVSPATHARMGSRFRGRSPPPLPLDGTTPLSHVRPFSPQLTVTLTPAPANPRTVPAQALPYASDAPHSIGVRAVSPFGAPADAHIAPAHARSLHHYPTSPGHAPRCPVTLVQTAAAATAAAVAASAEAQTAAAAAKQVLGLPATPAAATATPAAFHASPPRAVASPKHRTPSADGPYPTQATQHQLPAKDIAAAASQFDAHEAPTGAAAHLPHPQHLHRHASVGPHADESDRGSGSDEDVHSGPSSRSRTPELVNVLDEDFGFDGGADSEVDSDEENCVSEERIDENEEFEQADELNEAEHTEQERRNEQDDEHRDIEAAKPKRR